MGEGAETKEGKRDQITLISVGGNTLLIILMALTQACLALLYQQMAEKHGAESLIRFPFLLHTQGLYVRRYMYVSLFILQFVFKQVPSN